MKRLLLGLTIAAFISPLHSYAEKPVVIEKHSYQVSEPKYKNQYYINQSETNKAWNVTRGSSDILVALIDSSADRTHSELKSVPRILNSMKGPYSADYHGTHTSGIMASKHNKSGIAGMAPSVRYDFYNVFYGKNSEYTDSWTVAKAVDKAVANGATIINLSLGGDQYDKVLANSIKAARSKGIIIVASSGNDSSNKVSFPANMKEVVAVGAVDAKHRIASFSNMNKDVKIVAPGVSILSLGVKNQYVYMDGTSMAAPMVTSALALVKSVNPYLTPSEIDNLIAKMPRANGKSYTELNTKRLLDATPQPITVTAPQNIVEPYVRNVQVKPGTAKKVKTSLALYQGSKKLKTLPVNKEFTMFANGDWLSSGQYKLVAKVSDGTFKRQTSKTFNYVNNMKSRIRISAKDKKTFEVDLSRKGNLEVRDVDGKIVFSGKRPVGTFFINGDTTKTMTFILRPDDRNEKSVKTIYYP